MKLKQVLSKQLQTRFASRWEWRLLAIAPATTILVGALAVSGMLQPMDWIALDHLFRLRPLEPADPRIVVVTIDDPDITQVGRWPIPDAVLAELLLKLRAQRPRAIALDLYRDLPVDPGHEALVKAFQATPGLLGIQKKFGIKQVPPPPVLAQRDQVAIADLVEDDDGKVRRAMLTASDETGQLYVNLGAKAALNFLATEGITPDPIDEASGKLRLGRTIFTSIGSNDGGYVDVDASGYQTLLNFRGPQDNFQTISLTKVLHNQMPANLIRDRIVFIGVTAESIHDTFLTPYDGNRFTNSEWTPGVFIHANIASQILSAALDGRPLLQCFPRPIEILWVFIWASVGVLTTWRALQTTWFGRDWSYAGALLGFTATTAGLTVASYLLFLGSWWMPLAAPLLGLTLSTVASVGLHGQKLQRFAYFDGLTQIANRRYFDLQLAKHTQTKGNLSLILCDVDCFKNYNDTYGHQAGDACLQQVAIALRRAIRRRDMVARYGGEEFVVILPHTDVNNAAQVAAQIVQQVRALKLPHASSLVAPHVTLSCGVMSVQIDEHQLAQTGWSSASLVAKADEALYVAKREGRDRFVVVP